eukprot:9483289-Pyramimonas_sp.AAC.1
MSNSFNAKTSSSLSVSVVNIGTVIGLIAATLIIGSTVVGVPMIPRPPKPPTRTEVPAGKCPAVSANAAATVAPT